MNEWRNLYTTNNNNQHMPLHWRQWYLTSDMAQPVFLFLLFFYYLSSLFIPNQLGFVRHRWGLEEAGTFRSFWGTMAISEGIGGGRTGGWSELTVTLLTCSSWSPSDSELLILSCSLSLTYDRSDRVLSGDAMKQSDILTLYVLFRNCVSVNFRTKQNGGSVEMTT